MKIYDNIEDARDALVEFNKRLVELEGSFGVWINASSEMGNSCEIYTIVKFRDKNGEVRTLTG